MDLDLFRGKRVLVTGGAGLIGTAFVDALIRIGAQVRTVRRSRPIPRGSQVEIVSGDLLDPDTCAKACSSVDAVIHAAGESGGSGRAYRDPIPMFTRNLLIQTQLLESARAAQVGRYLFVSSSAVYAPSDAPLREDLAWGASCTGAPENETGMVKRAGETQCALYARCSDMRIAILRAGNAYGPHDNFDLETAHVVPALVRKALERQDPFVVWGSGRALRDFIYTDDIARAGLWLLAENGRCEPVNVATVRIVAVRDLVELILDAAGHRPREIRFGATAPPTSAAKRIDVTLMRRLGFEPEISLEKGLRLTVDWYRCHARGDERGDER